MSRINIRHLTRQHRVCGKSEQVYFCGFRVDQNLAVLYISFKIHESVPFLHLFCLYVSLNVRSNLYFIPGLTAYLYKLNNDMSWTLPVVRLHSGCWHIWLSINMCNKNFMGEREEIFRWKDEWIYIANTLRVFARIVLCSLLTGYLVLNTVCRSIVREGYTNL